MSQNLFATDPDLKAGFLANRREQNKQYYFKSRMPKRKRSYSGRRYYRRKRARASASSVARQMAKILQDHQGYGNPKSATWQRYGPSEKQMRDNPGTGRTAAQTQARLIDNYRGPGDVWSDIGKWGSRIGGAGIGAVISGNPWAGAKTGWDTGARFSKAMGWGDTAIEDAVVGAPVENDLVVGDAPKPLLMEGMGQAMATGSVTLKHREFVGNVVSSSTAGGFKIQHFGLNAGDEKTFPQLAYMSKLFEKFRVNACAFEYIPMTGFGGDSNALGVVTMSTQVDPRGQLPQNKNDVHAMNWTTSGIPARHNRHIVEAHPEFRNHEFFYVKDENTDRPVEFLNPATISISSEGVPTADQVLGELWVSYNVTLSNLHHVDEAVETITPYSFSAASYTKSLGIGVNLANFNNALAAENTISGNASTATVSYTTNSVIDRLVQDSTYSSNGGTKIFAVLDPKKIKKGDVYLFMLSVASNETPDGSHQFQSIHVGCGGFGYSRIDPSKLHAAYKNSAEICGMKLEDHGANSNTHDGEALGITAIKITKEDDDPSEVTVLCSITHLGTGNSVSASYCNVVFRLIQVGSTLPTLW
jgi:hypothetical protein